jgi:hypothetical protein
MSDETAEGTLRNLEQLAEKAGVSLSPETMSTLERRLREQEQQRAELKARPPENAVPSLEHPQPIPEEFRRGLRRIGGEQALTDQIEKPEIGKSPENKEIRLPELNETPEKKEAEIYLSERRLSKM